MCNVPSRASHIPRVCTSRRTLWHSTLTFQELSTFSAQSRFLQHIDAPRSPDNIWVLLLSYFLDRHDSFVILLSRHISLPLTMLPPTKQLDQDSENRFQKEFLIPMLYHFSIQNQRKFPKEREITRTEMYFRRFS